ncbi:hypothetical protein [Pseudoalteromonas sp. HL-AS1]|uniref:hypothetical protein n=1 Tax=Pseudoalteromonas sp. HL-AS1 TaxID=3071081 RepID=UPI002815A0F7|nr:hypothetical protein [Pseudoalteromonas sp. HL-AS1]WMS91368.1 hypothetical protein RB214_02830 [Pseudoalteromonas sp. HL-AS1]WMT83668.1 hypothetical protein PHIACA1_180 [Pseudoalteromonas phage ACA1]WMT83720.1 hypothetical protein PHIACA2_180 [Pseudoalteromonas phage ACA2]WMT83772.1 hypothetical protein PROACA1A_180 [Pseudoalteromonas phage proACA1-A]
MTIQISKVLMPMACISCQAFCPKGFAEDQHSPFITKFDKPKPKTQYGQCGKNNNSVFATEICNGYQQEPNANVFTVTNRTQPKQQVAL